MRINLPRKAFTAAVHCAGKTDVRSYLNGVYVGFPNMEQAELVSTDGNVMFACVVDYQSLEKPVCPGFSMIVPREVCEALRKGKFPSVTLEAMPDGRYILDGHAFTPAGGKFPDFRRVIPNPETCEPKAANYDPELLQQCSKAMREFRDTKKSAAHPFKLSHFGHNPGVMHDGQSDCLAVCMPLKENPKHASYFGLATVGAPEPATAD